MDKRIDALKDHFGVRAMDQIRRMLTIDETLRPKSLNECLDELSSQGDLDDLAFVSLDEEQILPYRFSKM